MTEIYPDILCKRLRRDGDKWVMRFDLEAGHGREFESTAKLLQHWLNIHGKARIVGIVEWGSRYSTYGHAVREGFKNYVIFKLNSKAEDYVRLVASK